jgi:hypothetical protein
MSIRVQCQFCGHISHVDDARAGQFIDCENCKAQLTVPEPEVERQSDDGLQIDGEPPGDDFLGLPSRRFWAWTFRLLGGFAILGLLVALIVVRRGWNAAPNRRPAPGVPAQPQVANRRPARQPGFARRGAAPARNWAQKKVDALPLISIPWTVVVERQPEVPTIPSNHVVHIPIPEGPNPEIVFPVTPSTMVSVGNAGHGREFREIWDFRANRRIGTTRGLRTLFENLGGFFRPLSTLSPDGRIFVTQGLQPFDLVVWDVVAEKPLGIRVPQHAPTAGLIFAALAGRDRLLACGFGAPFQILGVAEPSQNFLQRFPRETEFDRSSLAISPGGRYLAVFDKSRLVLRFYDTNSGSPAGQLPLPAFEPAGPMNCECVAFSADGREVSALFYYNFHSYLACWDLRAGRLVDRIDFGGNLRAILAARDAYLFAPLEWFPDQTRWLVYGQGIVDRHASNRQTGKLIWIIPNEPNRYRYGIRHVAASDCVLSVMNEGQKLVLGSIRLPLADIDRNAKISANLNGKGSK